MRHDRMFGRQRRDDTVHLHGMEDRQRAAGMVAVGVTHDQCVEPRDAGRAQEGHDDAAAGVDAVVEARTGVVKKRVMRGGDQHREALPHVEHDHAHTGLRDARR
jgi:hypothetical protein